MLVSVLFGVGRTSTRVVDDFIGGGRGSKHWVIEICEDWYMNLDAWEAWETECWYDEGEEVIGVFRESVVTLWRFLFGNYMLSGRMFFLGTMVISSAISLSPWLHLCGSVWCGWCCAEPDEWWLVMSFPHGHSIRWPKTWEPSYISKSMKQS